MKTTLFKAIYEGSGEDKGRTFIWKVYRDLKHGWTLIDYNGHKRTLEATWVDSLPTIRRILSNHGMTCPLS